MSKKYENHYELNITAFDTIPNEIEQDGIYVFANNFDKDIQIPADKYNFRELKIMTFDKNGMLVECGGNVRIDSPAVNGSAQRAVVIQANGFMVAFGVENRDMMKAYYTVMEGGAVIYNATMNVIYPVKAQYNIEENNLTVEYDNPTPPSNRAKKFLFVGNSGTYFNGTPLIFKGLARASGLEIDVTYSTIGGIHLSHFADETHRAGVMYRDALNKKKYDFVVFQDASQCGYEMSKPALDILVPMAKNNGATPLLYMRYATNTNPAERKDGAKVFSDSFNRISCEMNLVCAPVAEAFLYCTDQYPDINLYADDMAHHSALGAYLAACVWLISYLGVDVVGNTYCANLPKDVCLKLQKIATLSCKQPYPFK
ncbi:MAG: hypothetical protein J6Q89_02980 [Clostridia bacterium]|nr:hypothetical protein [Clostridia bacterium]